MAAAERGKAGGVGHASAGLCPATCTPRRPLSPVKAPEVGRRSPRVVETVPASRGKGGGSRHPSEEEL